jgi:hypothetical protein
MEERTERFHANGAAKVVVAEGNAPGACACARFWITSF